MKVNYEYQHEKLKDVSLFRIDNDVYDAHFHSNMEMCYVLSGKINITLNGQRILLEQDDYVLFLPNDIHSYQTEGDSTIYILVTPVEAVQQFLGLIRHKKPRRQYLIENQNSQLIKEGLEKLTECMENPLRRRGCLYDILGIFYENMDFSESKKEEVNVLPNKIIEYLNENFKGNISLKKMSFDLGYNTYYLSHFFNYYFNCSFKQYLHILRLKHFITLVREENSSITDAALSSGFNSVRTLNRVFKEEFGMTPKEYRKNSLPGKLNYNNM